jgi:uncharacterized membrane protein YgcG
MSKSRMISVFLFSLVMTALVCGAALAAAPVPAKQDKPIVHAATAPLPGDMARLEKELAVQSNVKYKILVVDDTQGEDLTAYLDRVAAEWKEPAPESLLLVIAAKDNYNLRFFFGANLTQKGMTVEKMLELVRTHYFANSQKGEVAGGLAQLISAVNEFAK